MSGRNRFHWAVIPFLLVVLAGICIGCKEDTSPPPAITIEALPGALETAFQKGQAPVKEQVAQILAHLKTPDYPAAYQQMQMLIGKAGLTKPQARVVASGITTLNQVLQEAQTKGDETATQTLENYRRDK